jgi:putative heme-binding domain-containing protein
LNAAEFATGSKGAVFFGKVLDRFATLNADEKGAAVQALAGRVEGARLLLNAVSEGRVRRMDVPVFAARQIAGLKDSGLAELLEKVWGVVRSADQDIHAKNAEAEHARLKGILTNALLNQADLPAGRVLFKSVCGQCHQLFGEGGRIGPDLTGSNRANLDYVLENVTNPNAVIGKDYELHVWTLKDGKVINGMIRQESDAAFTVQTFAGEEQVSKSEVQSVQKPGVSMMPAGLFSGLSKEQMRDLVGYLRSPRQVALPGEREMQPHVVNGVLEAESLKILSRGLPVGAQVMRNFQQGIWSRDQQLFWRGGKVGDVLELAIPVATKGRYQLKAALTRAPDYGIVRFLVNGMPVGGSVDLFGSKVTNTEEVPIGEIDLPEGQSVLGVEILGANTSARPSRMFGLDYLRLEPIP